MKKNQKYMGFDLVFGDFIPISGGTCIDWVIVCNILFCKRLHVLDFSCISYFALNCAYSVALILIVYVPVQIG